MERTPREPCDTNINATAYRLRVSVAHCLRFFASFLIDRVFGGRPPRLERRNVRKKRAYGAGDGVVVLEVEPLEGAVVGDVARLEQRHAGAAVEAHGRIRLLLGDEAHRAEEDGRQQDADQEERLAGVELVGQRSGRRLGHQADERQDRVHEADAHLRHAQLARVHRYERHQRRRSCRSIGATSIARQFKKNKHALGPSTSKGRRRTWAAPKSLIPTLVVFFWRFRP